MMEQVRTCMSACHHSSFFAQQLCQSSAPMPLLCAMVVLSNSCVSAVLLFWEGILVPLLCCCLSRVWMRTSSRQSVLSE